MKSLSLRTVRMLSVYTGRFAALLTLISVGCKTRELSSLSSDATTHLEKLASIDDMHKLEGQFQK